MMRFSDGRKNLMRQNASIIAENWLHLCSRDKVLIVTTTDHVEEIEIMKQAFDDFSLSVDIMVPEEQGKDSTYFDVNDNVFTGYSKVIGATNYSIITTKAVKILYLMGENFCLFLVQQMMDAQSWNIRS